MLNLFSFPNAFSLSSYLLFQMFFSTPFLFLNLSLVLIFTVTRIGISETLVIALVMLIVFRVSL